MKFRSTKLVISRCLRAGLAAGANSCPASGAERLPSLNGAAGWTVTPVATA